jgi:hypothetical protein
MSVDTNHSVQRSTQRGMSGPKIMEAIQRGRTQPHKTDSNKTMHLLRSENMKYDGDPQSETYNTIGPADRVVVTAGEQQTPVTVYYEHKAQGRRDPSADELAKIEAAQKQRRLVESVAQQRERRRNGL